VFLKCQGPNQRLTRLHYKESKDAKINIVNMGGGEGGERTTDVVG